MAEAGDNKKVVKMIASLSSFFRLSLSIGIDMIPVENEVKHVEHYLSIHKIRFNEPIDYSIEASGDLSGFKPLKNIIQPIAKNAIIHSVSKMPSERQILVCAFIDGES